MSDRYEGPIREDNIFVVGCQRSGTSAVYAGLIAHPDLKQLRPYDPKTGYDPKELYYFRNIFAARRQFASPMYGWDVDQEYLRRIIDLTVRFCAEHHGAGSGRWVCAHPMNGLDVSEILETMPNSRVVYVLRHPQEVLWSQLHAPWVKRQESGLEERVSQLANHWRSFAQIAIEILQSRFGESVLMVRHEELVEQTERVSAKITAHVGVSNDPAVLAQLAGPTFNSSFRDGASPRKLVAETRQNIAADQNFCSLVLKHLSREMEALAYENLRSGSGLAR